MDVDASSQPGLVSKGREKSLSEKKIQASTESSRKECDMLRDIVLSVGPRRARTSKREIGGLLIGRHAT